LEDKYRRRGEGGGGDEGDRVRRKEEERVVKENNLLVGRMEKGILRGEKMCEDKGTGGIKVSDGVAT